jgi:hypothetical protein
MYLPLLIVHNIFRWIALSMLSYTICRAYLGYRSNRNFSSDDNALRHWTATVLQLQMVVGLVLYFNSPFVAAFWAEQSDRNIGETNGFFAALHLPLMFLAVTVLSIGSALAKRKSTDMLKYKTMLLWFSVALLIILISIPWPFSPLAQRPYFRIS